MPTTIRTREPRELLALVPFQLGFHPSNSAVVLSVRAARSRIGLVARVDLADLADRRAGPQLARALVGHLVADGARRVVVVLYTDADLQGDGAADPRRRAAGLVALDHLQDAAEQALGALDPWVVGPHGYYALGCTDRACCPAGGRPLTDLQSTRIGAQMVLEGLQVAGSRDDLVRLPSTSPAARKSARRAQSRWRARGLAAVGTADLHRWRRAGLAHWREAFGQAQAGLGGGQGAGDLDGEQEPARPGEDHEERGRGSLPASFGSCGWQPSGPAVVGRLLAGLEDVLVRDAVLLTFVPDADRVADRVVAGDATADVGAALRAIIDPVHGTRPDRRRTAAARTVLEHLVAHAGRDGHAPALTLLAVLAWWEGDGARAGVLVDRALTAEPGHRLAVLMDDALRTGMPPGWVRAASA